MLFTVNMQKEMFTSSAQVNAQPILTDLNLLTCCWLQSSKINDAREIRHRVKGVDFPAVVYKKKSRVAQRKRAGPITQRSMDRNHSLLNAMLWICVKSISCLVLYPLDKLCVAISV